MESPTSTSVVLTDFVILKSSSSVISENTIVGLASDWSSKEKSCLNVSKNDESGLSSWLLWAKEYEGENIRPEIKTDITNTALSGIILKIVKEGI